MANGTQNMTTDKARILSTSDGTAKFWRSDNSWSNTLTDTLTVKGLVISDQSQFTHIDFSRTGATAPNYINVPASSSLAFSIGGATGAKIVAAIKGTSLQPWSDLQSSLGTSSERWNTLYTKTVSTTHIATPVIGSQTAQKTSSPYQSALWTFDLSRSATSFTTGDTIIIKTPGGGGSQGVFLSLDNGATYRPICVSGTARLTTHFTSGVLLVLTYDSAGQANSIYGKVDANGILSTTTGTNNVGGGCWRVLNLYDSGNTNDSAGYIRDWGSESVWKVTGSALYRYMLLLPVGDGQQYIPVNATSNGYNSTAKTNLTTAEFSISDPIVYYSHTDTVNSGSNVRNDRIWYKYRIDLRYSFNCGQTLTAGKDVYIVAQLQANNKVKLRNPDAINNNATATASGPITQTLPTSEDGYLYKKIGKAYNTYCISLDLVQPVYWYKDGSLRIYNEHASSASSISVAGGTTAKFWRGDNTWSNTLTGAIEAPILKLHQGTAADPSLSGNARIEFDYSGGQPVVISYTPNDSYRSPAGLKVMGGSSATPAWFEVEGNLIVGKREVTSSPSSLTHSNRITIVPYFHTGGPWYIKSSDDDTNAWLSIYYGSTQILRMKHDGTQALDWQGNAATATKATSDENGYNISNSYNKKYIQVIDLTGQDVNTWYPVTITLPADGLQRIACVTELNSGHKPSWSTHNSGYTAVVEMLAVAGGWGTTGSYSICLCNDQRFIDDSTKPPIGYSQFGNSSRATFWCRGGAKYRLLSDFFDTWTVYTSSTTVNSQTIAPTTTYPSLSFNISTITANIAGNAATSSALAYSAQLTATDDINGFNEASRFKVTTWTSNTTPGVGNGILISAGWTSASFGAQIAIDDDPTWYIALRQRNGDGWKAWKRIPMGDGTGASGTWDISVTGNATTASTLEAYASIGSSTTDHGVALKNWFTSNKSTAPRDKVISFYSSTSNNGSQYMGYFLSGYDNNPYGGFFVCHYDNPYYVGISNGTYTQQHILTSTNYTSYTVTKTGTGASGTWGINITGTAGGVAWANVSGKPNICTTDTAQTITGDKSWGSSGAGGILYGNATNGGINSMRIGDDVYLGDCNAAGIMGMKSTSTNCGFYMHNSSGTQIGQLYANGTGFYINKTLQVHPDTGSYTEGIRIYPYGSWATIMLLGDDNTATSGTSTNSWGIFNYNGTFYINRATSSGAGASRVYANSNGWYFDKAYGAVWNDFAEYRQANTNEPGRVIIPSSDGIAKISTERLQSGGRIISDTFGFSVGASDTAKTPIGVSGRVLAYPYQNKENYHIGDAVCTAPNGTVDIMTREEIIMYPERIIGIVNEIPSYEIWESSLECPGGDPTVTSIKVNGRIWIDIK